MQRLVIPGRFFFAFVMIAAIFSACISGDDDDEPTSTPIVITATPSNSGDSDPTSTVAATATIPELPTTTPTEEPSPTPPPSPTPLPPPPTATRAPLVLPTATPIPTPPPVNTGGLNIPDDLLAILPATEDLPAGLVFVDERQVDIADLTVEFDDPAAREQQLRDWGYQRAVEREWELPDDQIVDPASQLIAVLTRAVELGSPEAAQAEMNSFVDQIILPDPDVTVEELQIDPVGDDHRAILATLRSEDGESANIAALMVAAGPLSMQFLAAGGELYDPMPDVIAAANATLGYLGFTAGTPALGEVLLESDFSSWVTGDLDSGAITFGDDGLYHIRVDDGNGAFISAYSTDHDPYTDVAVSVDLRIISGDPTAQGCVLTRVDQVNQQFDYALCVDANGNVEALYEQFDAEGNYSLEPLLPGGIVRIDPPVEWTRLTIIARGDEFWFVVDGELIHTERHVGPTGGAAGVIVNHFVETPATPAEFVFTNLVVQAVQ